jgi:hypothetical protein
MRKLLTIAAFLIVCLFVASCASSPKKGDEQAPAKAQSEKAKTKEDKAAAKEAKAKSNEDKTAAKAEKGEPGKEGGVSVESLQKETETLMGKAKNVKADVAMKEDYAKAQAAYEEALKYKNEGNAKKAEKSFEQARRMFEEVYAKTEEKRARAERSIADSKNELKSVEEKARAAGML